MTYFKKYSFYTWYLNPFVFICFLSLQNQCVSAPGSNVLRCDKLDRDEIKNLLMCFLHILKSMSEGREAFLNHHTSAYCFFMSNLHFITTEALFAYWNKAAPSELMDFFTLIE